MPSAKHATFTIEKTYDAPPSKVWRAWSDRDEKAAWFSGPEEWGPDEFELDFRVGGREISRGGPPGGPVFTYDATYRDIVPGERFITPTTCSATRHGSRSRSAPWSSRLPAMARV